MCEKPSISKFLIQNTEYFDQNPRFSIEMLGISIEILGISKTCDNRTPYTTLTRWIGKRSTNVVKYSCC